MTLPVASSSLMIIGTFPELLGIGGVQESGSRTATALDAIARKRSWDIQILALNDVLGEHRLPSPNHEICFRRFAGKKVSFLLYLIRNRLLSRRGGERFVIARHSNLAFPAWMMKIFSRFVKTMVMAHGVEVWTCLPWLKWNTISHSNVMLGPSVDTVDKLIEIQAIAPGKVRKLAWPLSQTFLSKVERPELLRLPQPLPKGRVVLTVGRWAAAKRCKSPEHLLTATALLRAAFPSLHEVVVGQGNNLQRLRKLPVTCGVSASMHFLGTIVPYELTTCYVHAEVFAMPSAGEGCGLVFLEAMAFAKPVIATACGGTTDLVENGINGVLISPSDIKKLTEAIGSLPAKETFRTTLRRRGAELVCKKYRFEDFEAALDRILIELGNSYSMTVSQKHA